MRFLVTSKPVRPIPPDVAPALIEAMTAWANRYTENGTLEVVWSLAGRSGGGGICNVDWLEDLDALMAEYPLGPFSDVDALRIVELQGSLARLKSVVQAAAARQT